MAVQRLDELVLLLEALADPLRRAIGPREHAVGPPHLDRDEVVVAAQFLKQGGGDARVDAQSMVPHERGAEDTVDVEREAVAVVGDGLAVERAGEDSAQDDGADREDERAREQEDAQERERALGRRS